MTDHILNFAISVDDDTIVRNVQDKAEKHIITDIKYEVLKVLFKDKYYGSGVVSKTARGNIDVDRNATFNGFAEEILKEAFVEYKDEIIELAAEKLADSIKRSKKWKEKLAEVEEEC